MFLIPFKLLARKKALIPYCNRVSVKVLELTAVASLIISSSKRQPGRAEDWRLTRLNTSLAGGWGGGDVNSAKLELVLEKLVPPGCIHKLTIVFSVHIVSKLLSYHLFSLHIVTKLLSNQFFLSIVTKLLSNNFFFFTYYYKIII